MSARTLFGRSARRERGFTLVELLVVIAIIGVLAAITVPAVSQARDRAESTAITAEVGSYSDAAAVVLAASGSYPVPDPADVDDPSSRSCDGRAANGAPMFCCVAAEPCVYAGRTLAPLHRGAFARGSDGQSIFGGALARLPRLPRSPVAAGPLQYQGVFHSCDTVACQNPTVTWTQPAACPAGTTRNGVTGLCERKIDRTPINVTGQAETYCYDGQDNEGDGATDCADSDCAGRARCGAETSADRCADQFDNDGDGAADCADSGCSGVGSCVGSSEICDDSQDNDGDTLVDCDDSDCDGVIGPNGIPCQSETLCFDADDNDLDGLADCADPDCDGVYNPTFHICETFGEQSCSDQFDNDGDSQVDCGDTDCSSQAPCTTMPETWGSARCADDLDNDGDGRIDCADPDCASGGACGTEDNLLRCGDGYDNDGDRVTDCSDSGCSRSYNCGGSETSCTNGNDDDWDGSADCADTDCMGGPDCQTNP